MLGFAGVTAYLSYHLVSGLRGKLGQYVTKVQYSKDKELVFVQRVGPWGGITESVYEAHHLEIIPNINPSTAQYQLFQDGMYEVQSLNESAKMLLYKDDNLWNPRLKGEFLENHTQLITRQHYGLKR